MFLSLFSSIQNRSDGLGGLLNPAVPTDEISGGPESLYNAERRVISVPRPVGRLNYYVHSAAQRELFPTKTFTNVPFYGLMCTAYYFITVKLLSAVHRSIAFRKTAGLSWHTATEYFAVFELR